MSLDGYRGNRNAVSPYREATQGIRSSARWLVTAFAAVGGALAAGVPLTDLTQVDTSSSHFWLALVSAGLSLAVIGGMILGVSQVFTSRYPTLSEFALTAFTGGRVRRHVIGEVKADLTQSWEELFGTEFQGIPALFEAIEDNNDPKRGESAQRVAQQVLDYVNFEYARRILSSRCAPQHGNRRTSCRARNRRLCF